MAQQVMPVLFVGHGSPMIVIEESKYKDEWREVVKKIPIPKSILCISAHWFIDESAVNNEAQPEQIYDFYGFPKELYEVIYRPFGSPGLASKVKGLLDIEARNDWGIDHGAWSVLHTMYPDANIPVVMLSLDRTLKYACHYELGKKLRRLREEGVLIVCSGNIVHNLRRIDWEKEEEGFFWAHEFDDMIESAVLRRDAESIMNHPMHLAVPTTDHFLPLLYAVGASNILDEITVFNKGFTFGSISMTSYLFHRK